MAVHPARRLPLDGLRGPVQGRGGRQIHTDLARGGATVFVGATRTSQIKRGLQELADWLFRELAFPRGAFLFTGTGVVPGEDFTLQAGDVVRIDIDGLLLENPVR